MNEIHEIQKAILGACILEPKQAFTIACDLLEEDNFTGSYSDIWRAIQEMDSKGLSIDIIAVSKHMVSYGYSFGEIAIKITELTDRVVNGSNIETHCYILKQDYVKRRLMLLSSELQLMAAKGTDSMELLDKASTVTMELTGTTIKNEPNHISKAIKNQESEVNEIKTSNGIIGIPFGIDSVDLYTKGWRKKKLYILAGRPGMGKSIVALQSSFMASYIGEPVLFVSLEMGEKELTDRLISHSSGVHLDIVECANYAIGSKNDLLVENTKNNLSNHPLFLSDESSLNPNELKAIVRRKHNECEDGLGMLIVDYLQLMSGTQKGKSNREQEISEISRSLKQISKEFDIPVIALAQLSRAVETQQGDKRPKLSHLRESGSLEQDADSVIFLYRPEYYGIVEDEDGNSVSGLCEFIIAKNRGGKLGIANTLVDLPKMKFSEWSKSNQDFDPMPNGIDQSINGLESLEPNF